MAEPVFYGICANCIHARRCRFSLNANRPVHFCDHYEVNGKVPTDLSPEPSRRRTRPEGWADGRFRGLCVDCVKRFDCEISGTESGVWRCRDYEGPADDDS